jgi:hypothetical protein
MRLTCEQAMALAKTLHEQGWDVICRYNETRARWEVTVDARRV